MEAKDLMIRCWYTARKWRDNPFVIKYIERPGFAVDCECYVYGTTSEGSSVGPFRLDEIEPVSLTSEILEKNGFEKLMFLGSPRYRLDFPEHKMGKYIDCFLHENEHLIVSKWFTVNIVYNEHDYSHSQSCVVQCRFVHQLQQAIRLCGITKEIQI